MTHSSFLSKYLIQSPKIFGWWGQWMDELAQCNDYGHVFWKLWQAKSGPGYNSYLIKDINGIVLMTGAGCLNHWAEHFQQLQSWPPPKVDEDLLGDSMKASVETNSSSSTFTSPGTAAEVKATPRSLKNGHVPGIFSITAELLKTGGEILTHWLVYIINQDLIHEELPDDQRWGVILPFSKWRGDKFICSNYRGITLLWIPGKLFTHIPFSNTRKAVLPSICSNCQP